jgi:hypothetical protein
MLKGQNKLFAPWLTAIRDDSLDERCEEETRITLKTNSLSLSLDS